MINQVHIFREGEPVDASALLPVEIEIEDRVGVAKVRRRTRTVARALGFDPVTVEQIVLCSSELGNNLWIHVGRGRLRLEPLDNPVGLRLITEDQGGGIENIERALQDGVSSRGGMGSGLAAVRRLMDELTIHSSPNRGTRIEAIKWR